eukprot:scaffold186747_cov53-Prasinocladus_malaysianus.AAC.1
MQVRERAVGILSAISEQHISQYNAACMTADSVCHEESLCHVNEWEATLARPVCKKFAAPCFQFI